MQEVNEKVAVLGNGLEVWKLNVSLIKEQDINAQVMDDRKMKILTANVKQRGALESLPYVYKDGDTFRIISGHHRVRAANAAGLTEIFALVETNKLTKSQVTSKQIAHNALVGESDKEILGEMVKMMNDADDMIASGLTDDMLNAINAESQVIAIPQIAFDWRIIQFTFLPKQLRDMETLVASIENKAEFVGVARAEQYEEFCKVLDKYGKAKNVKSISTMVSLLIEIAKKEIEKCEQEDQENMNQSTTSRGSEVSQEED